MRRIGCIYILTTVVWSWLRDHRTNKQKKHAYFFVADKKEGKATAAIFSSLLTTNYTFLKGFTLLHYWIDMMRWDVTSNAYKNVHDFLAYLCYACKATVSPIIICIIIILTSLFIPLSKKYIKFYCYNNVHLTICHAQ